MIRSNPFTETRAFLAEAAIYIFFMVLATAAYVIEQKRKMAVIRYAEKNHNLTWKPSMSDQIDLMRTFRSRLFDYNKTVKAEGLLEGEYKDHSFVVFKVASYTRRTRYASLPTFSVGSCEFGGTEFPHILLKSKEMKLHQEKDLQDNKIILEQEYLKDFDLYCPNEYEIEVLQIFTEDLLRSIQQVSKDFSIEFGGNRIYVYLDKDIYQKKYLIEFSAMLGILKKVIDETDGLLFRLEDDFEVLDERYKK